MGEIPRQRRQHRLRQEGPWSFHGVSTELKAPGWQGMEKEECLAGSDSRDEQGIGIQKVARSSITLVFNPDILCESLQGFKQRHGQICVF